MSAPKASKLEFEISGMTTADLAEVHTLECLIFPDFWPEGVLAEYLGEDDSGSLVVRQKGVIIGYACFRFADNSLNLTNLAVDPDYRRKSVAKKLLDHILCLAVEGGAAAVHLEVRVSNIEARSFYQATGFVVVDRALEYYCDPKEDALVMLKQL